MSDQDEEQLFQIALQYHQANNLPQAEDVYRQILRNNPDHPDALHLLGTLYHQTGNHELAVEFIGRAIRVAPSNPFFHDNLGTVYQALGRLDDAAACYQKVLALEPSYAGAHFNLGNVLYRQEQQDAAATCYQKALALQPGYVDAHIGLGNAFKDLGKLDEAIACYQKALAFNPDYAEVHFNLGIVFQEQGKLDEAISCYRKVLAFKPDHAETYVSLANALRLRGNLDEATEYYRKILALTPDKAESHGNLGNILQEQKQFDSAIQYYRQALLLKSDHAETYSNLGNALRFQGKLEEASENLQRALSLNPDIVEAYVGLANVHIDLGQFKSAQLVISKALELQPEHPSALAILPELKKMTSEYSEWLNLALGLISQPNALSATEIVKLEFAIGKYYDDTKQYDLAFAAYRQGNMRKRQIEGAFDRASFSRLVDALIATYTADVVRQPREGASLSHRPLLIVGMPRSGTSLIEQIIASHPDVVGAGELTFWHLQASANLESVTLGAYKPALIAGIADAYEQLLQQYSAEAIRIVDKMPHNFVWLGLITAIFPHAKIIHAQRNPVDTCLSIYFQNFLPLHSYGTDLEDLAFYYREYVRLMRHWRAVMPADQFLEVPYEAVVDEQTTWSKWMIEFIGLDWDERCMDFHKTERKVGTASNWQVRQKIYNTSIARWRNYEKHLGPLRDLLDLNC